MRSNIFPGDGIHPAVARSLQRFRDELREHFGARLQSLILFGSQARGDAGPDSDIDVAVVLDRIDRHSERVWPMELAGSLEGPLLMPIVLSHGELEFLRAREDVLAENLDREGIALLGEAA